MDTENPIPNPASGNPDSTVETPDLGIVFEALKENRDGYFVEYTPARASNGLAILSLVFLEQPSHAKIVELMERECKIWLDRYPIPVQIMAPEITDTDHVGNSISYLLGIGPKLHWCRLDGGHAHIPLPPISEQMLLEIYDGIPYSTIEERRKCTAETAKSIRKGRHLTTAWINGVPLAISILGLISTLFSFLCGLYSIVKHAIKSMESLGYKKRSERKRKAEEVRRRMEHYFYHCEQNPEGFERLKVENFQRSIRQQTLKGKRELDGQSNGDSGGD